MQDLKDVTNNGLYENYRCQKLAAVTSVSLDSKVAASNRLVSLVGYVLLQPLSPPVPLPGYGLGRSAVRPQKI